MTTGDPKLDILVAAVDLATAHLDLAVQGLNTATLPNASAAVAAVAQADTELAQARALLDSYTLPTVPPVDPPTTGTRIASRWPYDAGAWCNRRIDKAHAIYGPSAGINAGYVNCAAYSRQVVYAKATDPTKTVTGPWGSASFVVPANAAASMGTDGVAVIVQPDGFTAIGLYQFNPSTLKSQTYVKDDLRGDAHDVGWLSTTKIGTLAGLLMLDELVAAGKGTPIPHVVGIALPPTILGPYWQWAAAAQDGAKPQGQTGNGAHGPVNYGALLAIRPGVNLDSLGLSTVGKSVAHAAQDLGVFVHDFGGQPVFSAEGRCEPIVGGVRSPIPELVALRADFAKIASQLVIIGNASNANPRLGQGAGTADGGARLPADKLPTLVAR